MKPTQHDMRNPLALGFLSSFVKKPLMTRAILGALILSVGASWNPTPSAAQAASKTYVGIWKETNLQLTPQQHFDALPREDADTPERAVLCAVEPSSDVTYLYVSKVMQARYPFMALGFHWEGDLPTSAQLTIDVRTSRDGSTWTDWLPTDQVDALRGSDKIMDTDLIFSSGSYLQYRVAVADAPVSWIPEISQVKVTYIDAAVGPSAAEVSSATEPVQRLSALAKPSVLSRVAWGADERYRYNQGALVWDPARYVPAQKIIIHHTATTNDPVDPAAAVRAIYYYHAVTLGWGDIGYNFLIDANGRVYEGRTGGPNVVGAHALQYNPGSIGVALLGNFGSTEPSPKAQEALGAFLIAKAVQHGIDPTGRGKFVDKDLPNIVGHRDAIPTGCPGDRLYSLLPSFQQQTAAGLPALGQAWLVNTTPKVLEPGVQVRIKLTVRNSGTATWGTALPNLTRVGYRWYLPDGTPYRSEPNLELHTDLPGSLDPRQQVSMEANLRVPATPGVYLLRWDMVQERVTWFMEQGNEPLETRVLVAAWASLPASGLIGLPNDLLTLLPSETLQSLPLQRLTLLSNSELVALIPDVIPLFPNERLLSFSNDILLRYVPDNRLKTFSLERIRTFPLEVQQRLGLAPTPTPTPTPTTTPIVLPSPSPTATPVAAPTVAPAANEKPLPTDPASSSPTPSPRSAGAPSDADTALDPGGATPP